MPNFINRVGDRHGNRVVQSVTPWPTSKLRGPSYRWPMMCDCGSPIHLVANTTLASKSTALNCGCVRTKTLRATRSGVCRSLQTRKKMSLALGGTATMSPYISKFVTFRDGYWQTTKTGSGSSRSQLHSRAVWEHFHGSVPDGMRVHHKDGCHKQITDDRLDNLMLLTEEWNIRFMPTLAKGFDVPEALVTQAYIQTESLPYVERFMAVCKLLAEKRYHETYFGAKNFGAAGRTLSHQQE